MALRLSEGLGLTWPLGLWRSTGYTPSQCEDAPNRGRHDGEQPKIDHPLDILKPQATQDQEGAKYGKCGDPDDAVASIDEEVAEARDDKKDL